MDTDSTIPAPLPVFTIIRAAFQFVWKKKLRMARALLIPVIAIWAVDQLPFSDERSILSTDPIWVGCLLFLIQTIPYLLFAVTCHRLALLGDQSVPEYGLWKWTMRESRYLAWLLVIVNIYLLIYLAVDSSFVSNMFGDLGAVAGVDPFHLSMLVVYPVYIGFLYLFSRLCVLYPAIAVGKQVRAEWVWPVTARNGWRLTLVAGFLPWVIYWLTNFLLRDNATWAECAIFWFAGFFLFAVEVVALSYSYKHLAQHETPPTSGS